jgi:bifunctional non-homologous end joining protein LigD
VRAMAIKSGSTTKLISRTRHSLNDSFPEIAGGVSQLRANSFILDGEIVALDKKGRSSFQLLQPFIHGKTSSHTRPPIVFYVFDILNLEGKNTTSLPLEERKTLLEKLLQDHPVLIRLSSAIDEPPKHLLKRIQKLGLEGLIGKRRNSHYEPGCRSGSWIKIKIAAQQEFVIGGYTQPRGSREFFGSLLVGLPSPRSDTHGVGASEMKHYTWLKPKLVAQIHFSQWTKDNHLRQPVFLGLRNDKSPQQVIREIAA